MKVTINFDDPSAYHLYYGDGVGTPGTIMTFFIWDGAFAGRAELELDQNWDPVCQPVGAARGSFAVVPKRS